MTLVKEGAIEGMSYEATSVKKSKKVDGKAVAIKVAQQLNTSSLLWLLVKRHKVGLLAIGNIILVLNWALPEWTDMVLGLVGK